MDISQEFRVTEVPDTVLQKDQIEADIELRCREIRDSLLSRFGSLLPYSDVIYVRRGEMVESGSPVYAVCINHAYVLIPVVGLKHEFRQSIELAGSMLMNQLGAAMVA
jgi:hypothetical protein